MSRGLGDVYKRQLKYHIRRGYNAINIILAILCAYIVYKALIFMFIDSLYWFIVKAFYGVVKTAYEICACLVGSEMCIRDRY
ncbi:hypothetical protein JMUB7529_28290 [Staphylococcus aureus]